jgi:hypothetical protein
MKRGVVGGQEEHGVGHLLGLAEPAHGDVHRGARGALGILGEQLLEQQRGVDRARAQRVDPDALRANCTPSSRVIDSTPPLDAE